MSFMKRNKKRWMSLLITACMLFNMMPFSTTVADASTGHLPGARSETNSSGDVFLGGNYIEVGISRHGSFGTSTAPTNSSFHPFTSTSGIGLRTDGDGWDVGTASNTGDFFLPGTPEERWVLAYYLDGVKYEYAVADRIDSFTGQWKTAPVVTDTSDVVNGKLSATVTGVTIHDVCVTLSYSFGVDDKYFKTDVDIENAGSNEITNVRFMRSFDPDQDAETHDAYETYNKVVCNPNSTDDLTEGGENNFAMVVAKGGITKEAFFFISFDERARGSILPSLSISSVYGNDYYGMDIWSDNPSIPTSANNSDVEGTSGYILNDVGIAITFSLGTILTSKSDSLTFYSSLDPNVSSSLSNIKKEVKGSVDYADEVITGFEANKQYLISYENEMGDTITVTVTADAYGKVPLVGTGTLSGGGTAAYDLTGKTVTIIPIVEEGETAVPSDVTVAARPDTPDSPTAPGDFGTADRPSAVPETAITISGTTITIDAVDGQEYSNNGGVTWVKPDSSGKVVFTNQPTNVDILIITRISATDTAPCSGASAPTTVRIPRNMNVSYSGYSGIYDGNYHAISVDATNVEGEIITYSESYEGLYTENKPTYKNVGSHTVYFRITKDGYYPSYGSAMIVISQATPVLTVSGQPITYGEKLSASLLEGSAIWDNNEVDGTLEWLNGDTIYPAVADSRSTPYTVVFTPEDTINYKSVQKNIVITVNSASQEQPLNIDTFNETISKKADGKITRVTDRMEYCPEGGSYTSVPYSATEITGLAPGKYYVRYMADDNHNASPAIPVIIQPGRKLTVTIPDNQAGYILTASKSSADWNEQVTLTFSIAEGYTQILTPPVKNNGSPLVFENGTCVITMQQDAVITVTGIEDITAPEGEITVGTSWWKELLNTITFNLFFNNSVEVTIIGTDKGSGIDTIEYYRSEGALTRSQVEEINSWSRYTGKITENARDAAKYVYYVKLTDRAGNIEYISSDGFVFDLVLPVIAGVKEDTTYYTTQKFTVNEKNFKDIEIKLESARNYFDTPQTDYTIEGNVDGTYIITITDKAGNEAVYTITMKPISDIYDDIAGITEDNVKSSDKDAIEAVKAELSAIDTTNATDAEKKEIADELAFCEGLLEKISDVGAEIVRVSGELPGDSAKEEYENRLIDIYKLLRSDNLTDNERDYIESKKDEIIKLIEELEGRVVVETKDQVNQITEDSFDNETNGDVKEAVDNAKDEGKDVSYHVVVEVIELKEIDEDDFKADAEKIYGLAEKDGKAVAMYLDLSVIVKADGVAIGKLTELKDEIEFKIKVPEELLNAKNRQFFVIRVHNGAAEEINCEVRDGYAYFKTNKFSTYALTYKDEPEKPVNTGDNTNLAFWLFIMALSALAFSGNVISKKRRCN